MTTPAVTATGPAALDVERVRTDFPALHQESHGHPLVYLDNAATTQKPLAVIDAVRTFYERDCSNVHRGVHLLSQRATVAYEQARTAIKNHIGAADSREIVFTRSTTEGINLVAASFVRPRLEAGDEVLISTMEHHSNIVPWQLLCEERGATLKVIPIDDDGDIVLEEYEAAAVGTHQDRRSGACLQRPRHHQPGARNDRARPRPRRAGPDRWGTGVAPPCG